MGYETMADGTDITWGDPWEMEPCTLLPVEAFAGSDDLPPNVALRRLWGAPDEETREHSRTVTWRFFSCTAGWPEPPTAADLYAAIQAEAPTSRQRAVIRTWLDEATYAELMLAWIEEAYTWRDLVAAAHRIGFNGFGVSRWLNGMARETSRA